ncbi:hypothetical protein VP464E531_P0025 [Vibrio phage 464E53-1]|nr:hypothetical protein VP464E531_P0025 [Vibrio phage 464E53-1]
MFSSVLNTKKFTGKHCLKNAARFISQRETKGERWEVVENGTERTVVYRRKHWEKN